MSLSTQPYKGTKDYYPEDMRLRNWMFDTWRSVCQSYGYQEYDGPTLEPLELYASKTSDEIVNEQTYTFTDRGDRKVAMRPEMTPTVSRMVAARRQEAVYPLRLFSTPNCFRYERPQRGRNREFWQLNADLFGVAGQEADAEIVCLADAVMKAFGAANNQYQIQISSRKVVQEAFDQLKLTAAQKSDALKLIDKKEKIEPAQWESLFDDMLGKQKAAQLLEFLKDESVPDELQDFMEKLKDRGLDNVVFNRYLARGFDYYTDIVFEVIDTNASNNRSMFGGGRYSGLVGQFGVEPVDAVGFGMGDATLLNFLEVNDLLPKLQPATDLNVVVVGDVMDRAQKVIAQMRQMGINVAVDLTERKLDKQTKAASKSGVNLVVFIGADELKSQRYSLKDLTTGKDDSLSLEQIIQRLKN